MQFNGAAEYYFYEGLREGLGGSLEALSEHPRTLPVFETQVCYDCVDSFTWGYMFGMCISKQYYDLIMKPKVKLKNRDRALSQSDNKVDKVIPVKENKDVPKGVTWNKGVENEIK